MTTKRTTPYELACLAVKLAGLSVKRTPKDCLSEAVVLLGLAQQKLNRPKRKDPGDCVKGGPPWSIFDSPRTAWTKKEAAKHLKLEERALKGHYDRFIKQAPDEASKANLRCAWKSNDLPHEVIDAIIEQQRYPNGHGKGLRQISEPVGQSPVPNP